ncbi:hypothetical protein RIF29_09547 [Crotalaria pallida]|uniref:F-box domain-containing protein n=1 Tax=Crotalaria pallida TaxID=3830 RepID=A0AAN9FUU0_CROPI
MIALHDEPDIISKLPDSILGHILSYLPTKYAVRTSALSKEWESKWTHITNLSIEDALSKQTRENRQCFINFVNKVLHKLSMHLELNLYCNLILYSSDCFRNLKIMKVSKIRFVGDRLSYQDVVLNFPDLKLFYAKYCNWSDVKNIIIEAPLLEEVSLVFQSEDNHKPWSPTFKVFSMNLKTFYYIGNLVEDIILSNPLPVVHAWVNVNRSAKTCKFLQQFLGVSFLKLSSTTIQDFDRSDKNIVMSKNLPCCFLSSLKDVTIRTYNCCVNSLSLTKYSLENTKVMEKLTIKVPGGGVGQRRPEGRGWDRAEMVKNKSRGLVEVAIVRERAVVGDFSWRLNGGEQNQTVKRKGVCSQFWQSRGGRR